ncbi:MAG: hypothetical protein ACO1OB_16045 [Archangium sp.]
MPLLPLVLAATQFAITPVLAKKQLQVEVTLDGPVSSLCVDMPGAQAAISGLESDHDYEGCFVAPKTNSYRYTVDLAALRRIRNDPDYATELNGSWLFQDSAALVHPAPLAPNAPLEVRFKLPRGLSVSTPWDARSDGTFMFNGAQHDAGAYVALGTLRSLGRLDLDGFSAQLTLMDAPKKASDDQLREWVRHALENIAGYYRSSPSNGTRPIHIVLAGVKGNDEAGVFGSVLRRREPSVMLLFGADAKSGFERDWVATHELFHLGNPPTQGRYPWFVEGFTTYATELLLTRSGVQTEAEFWKGLAENFRAYCQPKGTSLRAVSENLRKNHDWMRVYWGGACLAWRTDVAIRVASKGSKSLDDVMRTLRSSAPLSEDELVAALDKATGKNIASSHLNATSELPIESLLTQLGVGSKLDDDAPLAEIRHALINAPSPSR